MENEYGMIGALVGVTIIVVGFILVVFLGERQEREKEKLAKIKLDEFYQKEINEIKKEKSIHDTKISNNAKCNTKENQTKPIKKRVPKYNNENTLYIAYDFNILNNESYLDIRKKIINLKDNTKLDAIRTTSVIFFNSIYLDIFTDIILIKKSGVSISLKTLLVDNPSYYIKNKNLLKKPTFDTVLVLGSATDILRQIENGNIKFKREKTN